MTTTPCDEKGFSNLGRFVTLVRASARRPPRCRVRSRKVRTATSMCPRRYARVHERFVRPAPFPALALTAIPRTRPHVSRRFQVHAAGAAGVAPDADARVGTSPARAPTTAPRPRHSSPRARRAEPFPSAREDVRAASFRSPPKTGAPRFVTFSPSSRSYRRRRRRERFPTTRTIAD